MNTDKQSATSDEHVSPPGSASDATTGDVGNGDHPPAVAEDVTPPEISIGSSSSTVGKGKGKVVQGEDAGDEEIETTVNNNAAAEMEKGEAERKMFKTVLLSELSASIKRTILKGVPPPCMVCQKAFQSYPALFGHLPIHGKDISQRVTVTYEVDKVVGIIKPQRKEKTTARNKTLTRAPAGPSLQRDNLDVDFDLNLLPPEAEEDFYVDIGLASANVDVSNSG